MAVDVLLGLQWGDEGKGKIVDYFAPQYDMICRFQGGPNAGHTIVVGDQKIVLHTIPSGIFRTHCTNVIGNGVVIDPITLCDEIDRLAAHGVDASRNLLIAKKAHLILPTHRMLDAGSEALKGKDRIGSTLKGIGPTYMDKTGRNGLRIGTIHSDNFIDQYQKLKEKHLGLLRLYPEVQFDLATEEEKWMASIERLAQWPMVDGENFINQAIRDQKRILAEGAQGTMLDIDFGTYPYVTSSNTTTAGVCTGLGIAPQHIDRVYGVSKAYCTRVGGGPFPTELHDDIGRQIQEKGGEFGATTGRPRRCGWIDLPQLRYSLMINGVTELIITKIDVLDILDELHMGTHYNIGEHKIDMLNFESCNEDHTVDYSSAQGWKTDTFNTTEITALPDLLLDYIRELEKQLQQPIAYVSTGPDRRALVDMRSR